MDYILRPKNSILYEEESLPKDYGIIKAREALNKVHNIKELNEPELNPEFIKEVQNTEKQESVLVENLDDLFD